MRAEVISIGDEITTGQRLDTNSQWLSRQLTALGIEVAYHTTVGDNLDDNVTVFQTAIERADVVVATGGLGPTADDLTREALAAAAGVKLWRDQASLVRIQKIFTSRGMAMPERNAVQADFPEGAVPIHNPHGTAPGIELLVERAGRIPCAIFALPGVSAEMHEMWQATVAPRIDELCSERAVIRHRCIKCFGIGESHLEAMLPDLILRGREPKVGITVSDATISLRITAMACDEPACQAAMEPVVNLIRQSLGNLVFGEEDDELEHVVIRLLAARRQTLAVAEWATAGKISAWLAAVDPSEAVLRRGAVVDTYAQLDALCGGVLRMPPDEPAVAAGMAEAIRSDASADWGLSVAAYPPDPSSAEARTSIAISSANGTQIFRFGCASHPAILQARTAKQALNALRLELLK